MEVTERLIEVIEDRAALETGLRVILETAETGELPKEGLLPTFHDPLVWDIFVHTLEAVSGKKYE